MKFSYLKRVLWFIKWII